LLIGRRFVPRNHQPAQPEWAGTTLEWKVEATPEGSILHFSHRARREMTSFAMVCNTTWGELMYRLKTCVDTKRANPQWVEETSTATHEHPDSPPNPSARRRPTTVPVAKPARESRPHQGDENDQVIATAR
jgi:hypothetical protein